IVGERRAAKALGAVLGDPIVAVGDPDDIASEIAQYPKIGRIIRRVPMTDVDRGHAFRYAHAEPPWEYSPRRSPRAPRRSELLRGGSRRLDKLRDPLVAASQTLAVHRLKLGRREGMRRGARKQSFHPCL